MPRPQTAALLLLALFTAGKLALSASVGRLADEAYYHTWADAPALGYYDQPPLIAWMLRLARVGGDSVFADRLLPVVCGAIAIAVLIPLVSRPLWFVAATAAPLLCGLTLFATPDAPLLACWAVAFAAAAHGGRAWLVAGLAAGLAFNAKYTGLAVLPLLWLGAEPAERWTRWPWLAAAIAGLLMLPNLLWNAKHGGVSFVFQLHEGLWNEHPPALWGPLRLGWDATWSLTPVLALAAGLWMVRGAPWRRERVERLAWASSAPLWVFFAVCSLAGPPEAHWPAPAALFALVGLAQRPGRRVDEVGAALAGLVTLVLAIQLAWPGSLLPSAVNQRFLEGNAIVDGVRTAIEPSLSDAGAPVWPVYTERYQEAAFLKVSGIEAHRIPTCGRPDDYTRREAKPVAGPAWFLRPSRGGPLTCVPENWTVLAEPIRLAPKDASGQPLGRWDLFQVVVP